jgi:hypothetical protein
MNMALTLAAIMLMMVSASVQAQPGTLSKPMMNDTIDKPELPEKGKGEICFLVLDCENK